jgi:hypothetical protein
MGLGSGATPCVHSGLVVYSFEKEFSCWSLYIHLRLPIGIASFRSLTRSMQPVSSAHGKADGDAKVIQALLNAYHSFKSGPPLL